MTLFTLFDVAIYLLFKVWQKRNNTSIHALENAKECNNYKMSEYAQGSNAIIS